MKYVLASIVFFLALLNCSKNPTSPVTSGWEVLSIGTNIDLRKVTFVDENNGWVIGREDSVVFHTTDGGDTWNRQVVPPAPGIWGPYFPWGDIFFIDSLNGWAVTTSAVVYKTTDGGDNWFVAETIGSGSLRKVFFVDQYHGWAVGSRLLSGDFRSTDGGNTWSKIEALVGDFVDSMNGWGGLQGSIYRTLDGGISWNEIYGGGGFIDIDLDFVDLSYGWGLTGAKVSEYEVWHWIIHTSDGGYTWVPQTDTFKFPLGGSIGPMNMLNLTHGWIAKYDSKRASVLHTTDGGDTWQEQPLPSSASNRVISDIDFVNEFHGWVVGSSGLLLRTRNGGEPVK